MYMTVKMYRQPLKCKFLTVKRIYMTVKMYRQPLKCKFLTVKRVYMTVKMYRQPLNASSTVKRHNRNRKKTQP